MKINKSLSIIIPVYNVQKYLRDCINSIIRNSFTNYEIILIDDGSTDKSGSICDFFMKEYPSIIRTFHKENGGLSDARNYGIKVARGEYLMFIDSDDFINDEVNISELYRYMKYDIIQYKMLYYYENTNNKIYLKDLHTYNNQDIKIQLKNKIADDELSISACNKIIRRKLIIENNLYFEKGLLSEDIDWSLKLYLAAETLYTTNLNIYVYRQNRKGSITNTTNNKIIVSLFKIIKKWVNYSFESEELKYIYLNYLAYQYLILIAIINKRNCSKEFRKQIYQFRFLLKYNGNYKVKLSNIFIKIFGFNVGILILKSYLILKNKGMVKL